MKPLLQISLQKHLQYLSASEILSVPCVNFPVQLHAHSLSSQDQIYPELHFALTIIL